MASSGDALWIVKRDSNALSRLDPGAAQFRDIVSAPGPVRSMSFGEGALWLVLAGEDTIARYAMDGREPVTAAAGRSPTTALVAGNHVFVSSRNDQSVLVFDPGSLRAGAGPDPGRLQPDRARGERGRGGVGHVAGRQHASRGSSFAERALRERGALLVLGEGREAVALVQRRERALDRVDGSGAARRRSRLLEAGAACRSSRIGRARASRTRRWAGVRSGAGASACASRVRTLVERSTPHTSIAVAPTVIVSPAWIRRRPRTRSPLTNVPLCERPSSCTTRSAPSRTSSACRRETSMSHGSATSQVGRRPIVNRDVLVARLEQLTPAAGVAEHEERDVGRHGGIVRHRGRRRSAT